MTAEQRAERLMAVYTSLAKNDPHRNEVLGQLKALRTQALRVHVRNSRRSQIEALRKGAH